MTKEEFDKKLWRVMEFLLTALVCTLLTAGMALLIVMVFP